MEVMLRPYEACGGLAVGLENSICAKIVTFIDEHCVSIAGGPEKSICAKIMMQVFKECYCGVGMLSTEGPSSFFHG